MLYIEKKVHLISVLVRMCTVIWEGRYERDKGEIDGKERTWTREEGVGLGVGLGSGGGGLLVLCARLTF